MRFNITHRTWNIYVLKIFMDPIVTEDPRHLDWLAVKENVNT